MAKLHSIADIHKRAKVDAIIAADPTLCEVTRFPTVITARGAAGVEVSAVKGAGRGDRWSIMVSERIAKEQGLPLWRDS